jgi:hypothetical protein
MRKLSLVMVVLLFVSTLQAQNRNFWTPVTESSLNKDLFATRIKPTTYQLFQLNEVSLKTAMATVPSEKNVSAGNSSFILSMPGAQGQLINFKVVEAPVMDPSLAARYPGINSYIGKGIDDASATIRFDVSPQGFHGMILHTGKPTIFIDPIDAASRTYIVVSRDEMVNYRTAFQCLTEAVPDARTMIGDGAALRNADDGRLRTFRLALCATGEFSQFWLDGTEANDTERKAKVLAAQNTQMTRANGIFERDFGLRLVLVPNNDAVIYLSASSDPWTSNNLNSGTQTTCDNVIGSANYDIGHLVHRASDNGNAGCIGCVCKSGQKGSGFTSYLNLTSDFFVVDYLTHEMGHQLGANHTFTFSNEGTIAQMEPGSGSTIMGYAGITGSTTDVQPHSDDYFHAISIEQVTNYIKSSNGGNACAAVTITGNSTPTAAAGSDYVIPRSTPFTLTGSGTDADGSDVLTYCWEQMNTRATGFSTVPSATATAGPQFRSYLPVATPSRTFPQLSSILSGTNSNKWEVLPSVARTLNFRVTVRDNHPGAGNNFSDDMVLTISGTTGPFAVTAPNTAVTWGSGTTQTVTWSVNGTNGSPVNCANVAILLSTDGGQTFPIVLAESTPNDGSQVISVPGTTSSSCRIKVEAIGNIFFDISNTNFTIGAAVACGDPTGLTATNITTNSATVSWSAVSGANNYDVDYKTSASSTWISAVTGTSSLSANLSDLTASTSYDWRVRANCSSSSSNYSQNSFTTTGAGGGCPGIYDVSSNGNAAGAATIPLNTNVLGNITSRTDVDYYAFEITTGGTITITLSNLPANYQLALHNSGGTQLALSQNNGTASETINASLGTGTYYARVFPKANASNSSCYTLRVQTGTASRGGAGEATYTQVSIYPNPARSVLNISLGNLEGASDVQLFDVQGRMVIQRRISAMSTLVNVEILPSGVYMVKIKNNGIEVFTSKFIKE